MIDFVGKRYLYFLISALIILPGVVSLLLPGGLKPGIDFSSGSIMTIRFEQPVDQSTLREEFAALGHPEAIVQRTGGEHSPTFLVRTLPLKGEQKDASGQVVEVSERQKVADVLKEKLGNLEVLSFDSVSPIIAAEIVRNAAIAVAAASVGILLYIAYAFRRVRNSFRWGTCAVIALVHDSLVVLGAFSILGRIFHIELDSMFITAVLTVIGFSVHDTIVVFDRIRENIPKRRGEPFEVVVNRSLLETLHRSLATQLNAIFVLIAVLLFGGATMKQFVTVLLIGLLSGTYSSIFNAVPLLVVWEKGEVGRFFRRLLGRQPAAA